MFELKVPMGRESLRINAYTPEDANAAGVTNWSLKVLQKQGDMARQREYVSALYDALLKIGVVNAYAPSVAAASAKIIDTEELTTRFEFGRSRLHRNSDKPADGCFIKPGEAFVISAAGCPIIIASHGEHLCVAHAGRDSLIDRGAMLGQPTRQHMSVVDGIVDAFSKRNVPTRKMVMTLQFAIPQIVFDHPLDDPKWGAYNQAMHLHAQVHWPGATCQYQQKMYLDIGSVFLDQAAAHGIRQVWVSNRMDEFPDLAHTRDGKDPLRRNLVIVKRAT